MAACLGEKRNGCMFISHSARKPISQWILRASSWSARKPISQWILRESSWFKGLVYAVHTYIGSTFAFDWFWLYQCIVPLQHCISLHTIAQASDRMLAIHQFLWANVEAEILKVCLQHSVEFQSGSGCSHCLAALHKKSLDVMWCYDMLWVMAQMGVIGHVTCWHFGHLWALIYPCQLEGPGDGSLLVPPSPSGQLSRHRAWLELETKSTQNSEDPSILTRMLGHARSFRQNV